MHYCKFRYSCIPDTSSLLKSFWYLRGLPRPIIEGNPVVDSELPIMTTTLETAVNQSVVDLKSLATDVVSRAMSAGATAAECVVR